MNIPSLRRFLRRTAWCALALAGVSLSAMTVVPPTFHQLTSDAAQIQRIEVTAVEARWDDAPTGRVIHTYVTGRVLRNLKGPAGATVTLRFLGGEVDGQRLHVADMPQLKAGERYILFVADNGKAFCPLVGVMYGDYPIVKDPATGVEKVVRYNHTPLRSADAVNTPATGEPVADGPVAAGTVSAQSLRDTMTVEAFEAAIQAELSAKDSGEAESK
jgi:hypothetical protein